MSLRKTPLVTGEHYHIYNRGVDKRTLFNDILDINRFFQSILEFNCVEPIGSIYENSFKTNSHQHQLGSLASKLVRVIAYCINPNHFHFILKQESDRGIEKFMHRVGTGYTKYFNERNKRSGSLFQGTFKSVHVDKNEYLLHLSAYVNLNDRVHNLGSEAFKLRSSWKEYLGEVTHEICDKKIILEQFENIGKYKIFALDTLKKIIERKEELKELEFDEI